MLDFIVWDSKKVSIAARNEPNDGILVMQWCFQSSCLRHTKKGMLEDGL